MIAVLDVCGNNLASLSNALSRLGYNYLLTHDAKEICNASHLIIPGVGTAPSGMNALKKYGLVNLIKELKQPVLGICLGMQLLYEYSEEGQVECLGLLPGKVTSFSPEKDYPVPHMGWNSLNWLSESPLQANLPEQTYMYFVHSYARFLDASNQTTVASCEYNHSFSAIVQRDNKIGMQFHPEKSAQAGLQLLHNFLRMQ
ncbi:imidazole glycerol phosphate synthase subunit HisH [Legionella birminghamensis]|uniref:Imidazole glycerol phosphate synthase subunit HisH n=1 Tax=Legionella birminghamensis TaxID=28083 RepID=A0A378IID1_9GAMM|nr:imidazole glycerol phosphate synthase subunit HisH [Legionella birminghamensis]KTC75611.1 imidazole glycerol phosphate synthase subunit HisH [Legionella birminghamensis]STX31934.1 imidazole glycerol phosphate synthase subunit HisH [Legionella birminghamensis]